MNIRIDIRKLAIVVLLISLASTLAQVYDIITTIQMVIINVASSVAMMILVIISIYRFHKMVRYGIPSPDLLQNTVVIPKILIENTMLSANSDLLKKGISSTSPFRACVFRIYMEINNTAEKLSISAIRKIESNIIEDAKEMKSVIQGMYIVDTIVGPRENVNFKFNNDIYIKKLSIEEYYMPR